MLRLFLFILIFSFFLETGYCEVSREDVMPKVADCIYKRSKQLEGTITDYRCPTGDVWTTTNKPITEDTICGSIYMQLKFKEIDTEAEKFMVNLQSSRNPTVLSWIDEIHKKIDGTQSQAGLQAKYKAVCDIQATWGKCAKTTDFFPEGACVSFAKQKADAWRNTGYILASQGVAKSYQNDKDKFLDNTKTAYNRVLQKFQEYHQIVDTAVGKFTTYIRRAVK